MDGDFACLIVADESPEFPAALTYAALLAKNSPACVLLRGPSERGRLTNGLSDASYRIFLSRGFAAFYPLNAPGSYILRFKLLLEPFDAAKD